MAGRLVVAASLLICLFVSFCATQVPINKGAIVTIEGAPNPAVLVSSLQTPQALSYPFPTDLFNAFNLSLTSDLDHRYSYDHDAGFISTFLKDVKTAGSSAFINFNLRTGIFTSRSQSFNFTDMGRNTSSIVSLNSPCGSAYDRTGQKIYMCMQRQSFVQENKTEYDEVHLYSVPIALMNYYNQSAINPTPSVIPILGIMFSEGRPIVSPIRAWRVAHFDFVPGTSTAYTLLSRTNVTLGNTTEVRLIIYNVTSDTTTHDVKLNPFTTSSEVHTFSYLGFLASAVDGNVYVVQQQDIPFTYNAVTGSGSNHSILLLRINVISNKFDLLFDATNLCTDQGDQAVFDDQTSQLFLQCGSELLTINFRNISEPVTTTLSVFADDGFFEWTADPAVTAKFVAPYTARPHGDISGVSQVGVSDAARDTWFFVQNTTTSVISLVSLYSTHQVGQLAASSSPCVVDTTFGISLILSTFSESSSNEFYGLLSVMDVTDTPAFGKEISYLLLNKIKPTPKAEPIAVVTVQNPSRVLVVHYDSVINVVSILELPLGRKSQKAHIDFGSSKVVLQFNATLPHCTSSKAVVFDYIWTNPTTGHNSTFVVLVPQNCEQDTQYLYIISVSAHTNKGWSVLEHHSFIEANSSAELELPFLSLHSPSNTIYAIGCAYPNCRSNLNQKPETALFVVEPLSGTARYLSKLDESLNYDTPYSFFGSPSSIHRDVLFYPTYSSMMNGVNVFTNDTTPLPLLPTSITSWQCYMSGPLPLTPSNHSGSGSDSDSGGSGLVVAFVVGVSVGFGCAALGLLVYGVVVLTRRRRRGQWPFGNSSRLLVSQETRALVEL